MPVDLHRPDAPPVRMPVELIRSVGRRGKLDWVKVSRYRQMLRDGIRAPPVQVSERLRDGRWQLFDGYHRLKAAKIEGATHIEVIKLIGHRPDKSHMPT